MDFIGADRCQLSAGGFFIGAVMVLQKGSQSRDLGKAL